MVSPIPTSFFKVIYTARTSLDWMCGSQPTEEGALVPPLISYFCFPLFHNVCRPFFTPLFFGLVSVPSFVAFCLWDLNFGNPPPSVFPNPTLPGESGYLECNFTEHPGFWGIAFPAELQRTSAFPPSKTPPSGIETMCTQALFLLGFFLCRGMYFSDNFFGCFLIGGGESEPSRLAGILHQPSGLFRDSPSLTAW